MGLEDDTYSSSMRLLLRLASSSVRVASRGVCHKHDLASVLNECDRMQCSEKVVCRKLSAV